MARSDHADRHRLEYLEWETRHRPRRHAVRLTALVLLGYLYPLTVLALSFALLAGIVALAPLAVREMEFPVLLLYLTGLALALWFLWVVLKAFWAPLPPPDEQLLKPQEAPELRELIEQVQRESDSPPIHCIHLDMSFNAAVTQRPRFMIFGDRTNHLLIGLPLLSAFSPQQFRVILAHEFAHLRGRHSRFGAWIYRVQQTWNSLWIPIARFGRARRLMFSWFINWYGRRLAIGTLPLRRAYEYDADAEAARICGAEAMAGVLIRLSWISYRLDKFFWPSLIREGARNPVPPGDVSARIATLLATAAPAEAIRRWLNHEQRSRTAIDSDHPCLAGRLRSIGSCLPDNDHDRELTSAVGLALAPEDQAFKLLGACGNRASAAVSAAWKAHVIARWRFEHALATRARDEIVTSNTKDREWAQLDFEIRSLNLDEAMERLRDFLGKFPNHAAASFELGRLLLAQDDENATVSLEMAISNDSDYITPSLHLMLEYYRDSGRDEEADAIQQRLEVHQRTLKKARRERLRIHRSDRLLPHDLDARQLERIRRVLFQYPQIEAGWLARKQVRVFAEKPSYVLWLKRHRRLLDQSHSNGKLAEFIQPQLGVPCAVMVGNRPPRRLRAALLSVCPDPVFSAPD
jgi:Zn-dependent protease with chaperone function